jgi:hypothetical protein
MRKIFGSKRREEKEDGEICTVRSFIIYSSPSIIRGIKSVKTRWTVRVVYREARAFLLFFNHEGKKPRGRHV